jgi:hypothetical protein
MSKSKPFGRFPSIAAARENAQRMFKEYRNKGPIPKPDADDVADLLNNHPDKAEIIGPGVSYFCVESNDIGTGPCFVVVRIDGSKRHFSLKIALAGKHPPEENQVFEALGHEIWRDGETRGLLDAVRKNRPSRELMRCFIATEPLADWQRKKRGRGPTGLIDRDLAQRWIAYYWAHRP